MATVGCIKRLQTELKNFKLNPSPGCDAAPSETDILTWFYVIDGARDSDYQGGEYIGKISFPKEYPFKAPHIQMVTPNGRFEPNQNICMSMTAWHPESWQPSWQTATIIVGLQSFMAEDASAVAAIKKTPAERKKLAAASRKWNIDNVPQFQVLFPDRYERSTKIVKGEKVPEVNAGESKPSLIDFSKMKDVNVMEACKKANEAMQLKDEQSKAAKAAAAVAAAASNGASAGARRDREEITSSQKAPANSGAAKNKKVGADVIELD